MDVSGIEHHLKSLVTLNRTISMNHYFNIYFIHNVTFYTIIIYAYINDVSMVKGD